MTPGQLARKLLGPKLFEPIGAIYRAAFVDLQRVAESFPELPAGATLLEVGGGDGQMMNLLLRRYPDARATMIDISPVVGAALAPELRERVQVRAGTSIRDYAGESPALPDLIAICDVVHHVPPAARRQFFEDLGLLVGPNTVLVVKDMRPGSARAYLAYCADRYISGDKQVSFPHEREVEELVGRSLPELRPRRTALFEVDAPNFAIVFARESSPPH